MAPSNLRHSNANLSIVRSTESNALDMWACIYKELTVLLKDSNPVIATLTGFGEKVSNML